jgi:hypothetical protein
MNTRASRTPSSFDVSIVMYDAGGVVHRVEHVGDEGADLGADRTDRFGTLAQDGIGEDDERADGHGGNRQGRRRDGSGLSVE